MNRKLSRTVAGLLATSALAILSTEASAITITPGLTVGSSVTDSLSGTNGWTFVFGNQFGWAHSSKWHDLSVTTPGDIAITVKQTVTTDLLPAFTLWSLTGGPADGSTARSHQYNQVKGPTGTNAYLANAGVNGIVGYANSGQSFTNADSDFVGSGAVFSNPAVTGGSVLTGVDGSGLKFATLFLSGVQAGHYLIVDAGSDWNNTSGATTKQLTLSVAAVPVPAAVWLFGSALSGLIGWSRRKSVSV